MLTYLSLILTTFSLIGGTAILGNTDAGNEKEARIQIVTETADEAGSAGTEDLEGKGLENPEELEGKRPENSEEQEKTESTKEIQDNAADEEEKGGKASGKGRKEGTSGLEENTRGDGAFVYRKETRVPGKVTLSFAGDISFAEGYANMVNYHNRGDDITQCIMPDVIERMDSADIMMINNEFTYSRRGAPLSGKTFTFRAIPETAANLNLLSVDIVSLANNHVYDYGETALIDTLDTLNQYGIPYVGAGRNLEEAKKIVYFRAGGIKIAFVSATQVERSYVFTKEATNTSAGVLRTFSPDKFLEVIRQAEETSDFVVVYVHWGTEGVNQFEADQQLLGHQYIDAGADLVIGDHPHCLQGVEYYRGVPIFYSLGNYWFNSRTLDTGLVEADISSEGLLELRFVPCLQQSCRTSLVTDPGQQQRVFQFLEAISANASVDEHGVIREK